MANMIRVGMPINGHTRRFAKVGFGQFLYNCPGCTGLVRNEQEFCLCNMDLRQVSSLRGRDDTIAI